MTTGDIDGNVVSSNEPVTWNIFPNQKYARVAAEADEKYKRWYGFSDRLMSLIETKGKGFRFRIVIADIGDAIHKVKYLCD